MKTYLLPTPIMIAIFFLQCHNSNSGKITTTVINNFAATQFKESVTAQRIDSINTSLEWEEIKPKIWRSKNGDIGIKELRMVNQKDFIFAEDYITTTNNFKPLKEIIDLTSFEYLGNNFYCDHKTIYHYYSMAYGGKFMIRNDINKESFELLGDCYARDNQHVFTERGAVIENVDLSTFFTLSGAGCFAKDKNHYFFWDDIVLIEDLDSQSREFIDKLNQANAIKH